MRIGVAEARRRFRELLAEVDAGETVEITRRGEVVALIGPPPSPEERTPWSQAVGSWRGDWQVASWPDDDPFVGVRDAAPGRGAPW